MRSCRNVEAIYAIGECAEHKGMVHGLVQPIYEQASVLANHLLDELVTNLPPAIYSTKLVSQMTYLAYFCWQYCKPIPPLQW